MILNYLGGPNVVTRIVRRGVQEGLAQRMRCDSGSRDERGKRWGYIAGSEMEEGAMS